MTVGIKVPYKELGKLDSFQLALLRNSNFWEENRQIVTPNSVLWSKKYIQFYEYNTQTQISAQTTGYKKTRRYCV